MQKAECRMQNKRDLKDRTKRFALLVIKMFSELPKTTVAQVVGKQVLRSGTSVGANYREADRARSTAEFVAKMGDCLKEIDESIYWFELLVDGGIVSGEEINSLIKEANELTAIFVTIINKAKKNSVQ
ncbi:MAG: four helix bundle protein [Deltaproteobacteria bacterium RIFOXYD12_FULL_50_9]|nr:MAG: four helix bundle protein [Deltaproteobacteria bacterium RIFOXYD12_FULL_50_9]